MSSPALSHLQVSPAGRLLDAQRPVAGVGAPGPAGTNRPIAFRTEPARVPLTQLASEAVRVARANWLLLALAALLVLAACTKRSEALAPPAAPSGLATVPHGLGPATAWYHE